MVSSVLLLLFSAITILSSFLIFARKKLVHSVIFLVIASLGSAFLFVYIGQMLAALLQLLVFVGGVSTYLMVTVGYEENRTLGRTLSFLLIFVVLALAFSYFIYQSAGSEPASNDFSSAAQTAFSEGYGLVFAAVFLVFFSALGSGIAIRSAMVRVV